jgi:hypothetical protein
VSLLQFQEDNVTRPVAGTLRDIGKTFATDTHDGGRFMMWREEQRAIAERMCTDETALRCIGYATFVERYEGTFSRWFASFERDLEPPAARDSQRFGILQGKLALLASQLDQHETHKDQWERLMSSAPRVPGADQPSSHAFPKLHRVDPEPGGLGPVPV